MPIILMLFVLLLVFLFGAGTVFLLKRLTSREDGFARIVFTLGAVMMLIGVTGFLLMVLMDRGDPHAENVAVRIYDQIGTVEIPPVASPLFEDEAVFSTRPAPLTPLTQHAVPAAPVPKEVYSVQPEALVAAEFPYGATVAKSDREPAVWANLDDGKFDADVYPGVLAAVRPLAHQVRGALDENTLLPEKEDGRQVVQPKLMRVTGHSLFDKQRERVLQAFAEQVRQEFPHSKVEIYDENAGEAVGEAVGETTNDIVTLTLRPENGQDVTAPWDHKVQQRSGQLSCSIATGEGATKITTKYIEKPWVEEFGEFVSKRPGRQLVVGYSPQLVSSESEARRTALNDAQAKFQLQVSGGYTVTANETHVIDRFAQKLKRSYGDVWREAVLVDVSGVRMAPVIAAAETAVVRHYNQRFSIMAGLTGLLVVTMALCATLNLLTHGYYRRRLGMGFAAVGGLVVLGLLFIG